MQTIKYMFLFLSILTTAIAGLVTTSLLGGGPVYSVVAVWISVLIILIIFITIGRVYKRTVGRIGTANMRLAEIKVLQERRYEQTRTRLDYLLRVVDNTRILTNDVNKALEQVVNTPTGEEGRHDALEQLNARFQRAERRIIGRLENEIHENDIRSQQITALVSKIETAFQKSELKEK